MATFLLEIGTEELPADFARLVLPQLRENVISDLSENRLSHGQIFVTSTPRRIALIVSDLVEYADDSKSEYKGPPAGQAFVDGSPTKAASGFARRFDLQVDDLEIRDTPKGPFVFAKVLVKGSSAKDLLIKMIPSWLGNLQGRRFMRWGSGENRFSRPIRWMVALLDNALIPVSINECDPPVLSGFVSRGNRLCSQEVYISHADDYISSLNTFSVEVNRESRKSLITSSVDEAASNLDAIPNLSNDLLEELTDLVEFPSLIKGCFDEAFLSLPAEVLCTVMRVHQRYIPLFTKSANIDPLLLNAKGSLLSSFLCISNGLLEAEKSIQKGNERVLRARLADANFFLKSDLAVSSKERLKKLHQVTFSEGLGSLHERSERIRLVSQLILGSVDLSNLNRENLLEAASLCKHDLVSQMVDEFPELQGIMGAKYLLYEGYDKEIALAVLEHYLPRGADDELPKSEVGSVLAVAERIELLLSIFAKGERPSGSSDPYALRRAANGILQIVWENSWNLNLINLVENAVENWSSNFKDLSIHKVKLKNDLLDFFRLRIISLLEDMKFDLDIIKAVCGDNVPLDRLLVDLFDSKIRTDLLQNMRKSGLLDKVQSVVIRATRITEKSGIQLDSLSPKGVVEPSLFEKESEYKMLKILNELDPIVKNLEASGYQKLAQMLSEGADALSNYFDGDGSVMVMCDDLQIRQNRLKVLKILSNQASLLADFTSLNG